MGKAHVKVLTDTSKRVWVESYEIGPKDVGMAGTWHIRKTTLRGGPGDGVDLIEVNNGALVFSVLPTRGMGIWNVSYKGMVLGWQSPVRGPVHPSLVNALERGGLGWLRGFDETIVRCGLESNGAPCRDVLTNNMGQRVEMDLTLHGKIANTPANRVEVQVVPGVAPQFVVTGQVCETGLFLSQLRLTTRISTRAGSNAVTIEDEVTNMKGVPSEMELLYHCNFGPPVLEKGARLEVPARMVAPRDARAAEGIGSFDTYLGSTAGYVEQCYWYETIGDKDGNTLAMLRNAAANKAVVIRYNRNALPCFTQWKNTASEDDGYVTGLEPGVNFPNPRPFERANKRVVQLAPGARYKAAITLEALDTKAAVAKAQAEIAALQAGAERVVHAKPVAGYSDV